MGDFLKNFRHLHKKKSLQFLKVVVKLLTFDTYSRNMYNDKILF